MNECESVSESESVNVCESEMCVKMYALLFYYYFSEFDDIV